jgi:hypothetical protein
MRRSTASPFVSGGVSLPQPRKTVEPVVRGNDSPDSRKTIEPVLPTPGNRGYRDGGSTSEWGNSSKKVK